ncbi:MAG: DUF3365 domain-containing protein [Desulfurivibrionaceae bacterium]
MRIKILLTALMLSVLCPGSGFSADLEKRAAESREFISQYANELKSRLRLAFLKGGAVKAITVCSEEAPRIDRRFTVRSGCEIGRTSLKYRNPDNAPDQWEKKVLKKFKKQNEAGRDPEDMELYSVVKKDGKKYFRYMKAIKTEEVCLKCHGKSIAPEVEKKIDKFYPRDRARGFSEGDIRGAFTLVQPISNQ